jgi:hypothetical protein
LQDSLKHAIHISQHLRIRESQDGQAETCEIAVPHRVVLDMLRGEMLPAIDFDHQLRRRAEEVNNVVTEDFLSIELVALDFLIF